jgi:hypothetical protein
MTTMQVEVVVRAFNAISLLPTSYDSFVRMLPTGKEQEAFKTTLESFPLFGIRSEKTSNESFAASVETSQNVTITGAMGRVFLSLVWEAIIDMGQNQSQWRCSYESSRFSNTPGGRGVEPTELQRAALFLREHAVFEAKAAGIRWTFPITPELEKAPACDNRTIGEFIIKSLQELQNKLREHFDGRPLPEPSIPVVQGCDIALNIKPRRMGKNLLLNSAVAKKEFLKSLLEKRCPDQTAYGEF